MTRDCDASPNDTWWEAARGALTTRGRISATVVATAPTLAFVAANACASLPKALLAAGGVALASLAWRALRGEPKRHAVVGLTALVVCAAVAMKTGDARGFFLVPAIVPFVVIAICLGSIAVRRPLTGLLLNRVSGGPARWFENRALLRVHTRATLAAATVNVVNGLLQIVFYARNHVGVLAVIHVASGPVFGSLVAATIFLARRAMRGSRGPEKLGHSLDEGDA